MKKIFYILYLFIFLTVSFFSFAEEKEVRLFEVDSANINSLYSVAEMLKSDDGRVSIHSGSRNIIVHDYPENIAKIEEVINKLDIPRPQVEIKVIVAEVSDKLLEHFGIGYNNIALSPASYTALVNILTRQSVSDIHSTMAIRTFSGEAAAIQVSSKEIFAPVVTHDIDRTTIVSFSSPETGDFLEVIPIVKSTDDIAITVRPLVSSETNSNIIYEKSIFTRVNIKNGETAVLGSFAMDHVNMRQTGSGMKEAPLGRESFREKKGVVMFLTATII